MTKIESEKLIDPTKVETQAINDPDFTDILHERKIVGNIMTTLLFPGSPTRIAIFVDDPVMTSRQLGLVSTDAIPNIAQVPQDIPLPTTTSSMSMLYKLQKITYANYTDDNKEILDHLLQCFPCLAAKMDTTTGTFALFFTVRNAFAFLIQLHSTNALKQSTSDKYVQKFFCYHLCSFC